MDINLTPTQRDQLAHLRELREKNGRPWPGDEQMVLTILSRGIVDELDDERFMRRINAPALLAVQAS